jgi:hypothetical protein
MRLASIHTYPVKSCHRVDHDGAEVRVEPWGLAGDRRWLVVDPEGTCVTQREVAGMARVRPAPRPGGGLVLRAHGVSDLEISEPVDATLINVSVHRTGLAASPAGAEADTWLTAVLDRKVRLVWLDDPTRRPVDPAYAAPGDRVSFADAYPLLLANAASLDALNDWILAAGSGEGPLPMSRFRPNLVVSGAPAWAEDGWLGHRLRIGTVTFRAVKPCDRCVVTTTDQETGVRGKEPLRTLGKHRNINQKLRFGINLVPDAPYGGIAAGDPVTLLT